MFVEFLQLKNFRNYENLELIFDEKINVVVGKNGQGKTNLVEALYCALTGESFRIHEKHELIHKKKLEQNQNAEILVHVESKKIKRKIKIIVSNQKQQIEINDKRVTVNQLKNLYSAIVFSPDSLMILKLGPAEKRIFLDELTATIFAEHNDVKSEYQKCLKSRNRVLRMFQEGDIQRQEAVNILNSIEPTFLKLATQLTIMRLAAIKTITFHANQQMKSLFKSQIVDISVDYLISKECAIDWSKNQVYDSLKSRLQDLSEAEFASGMSLVGPHKHDFKILLNGYSLQQYGSQGQQRAAILSFKLAQIFCHFERTGEYPVLILDDVLSELDIENRNNVLQTIMELETQIFITATDFDSVLDNKFTGNLKMMSIEKGKVTSGWK